MSQPNHRLTKAERKEQARLEREEIRRRMEQRKRMRALGTGLVIGALVIGGLVFVLASSPADDVDLPAPSALLDGAEQAMEAASCEPVRTVEPYPGGADQTHVGTPEFPTMPDLSTYPSVPPTSGPHDGTGTVPAGIYDSPPPMGRLIHSLEHGGSVVWYDPAAPTEEIDRIKAFYGRGDEAGQDRVIVAPYDYPGEDGSGSLPPGTRMALVAWHRFQTCADPSLEVALDFTSRFSFPPSLDRQYEGEAPEPGAQM